MKSQQGPLVWSKLSLILVAAVSQKISWCVGKMFQWMSDLLIWRDATRTGENCLFWKSSACIIILRGQQIRKFKCLLSELHACIHSLFNWVKFSLILKSLCLLILLLQVECGLVLPHWLTCRWNPPLMVPLANLLLVF